MSGNSSFEVYWGGLLLNSCCPLEIWLNFCSASCAYCFSNLNRPDRTANTKQIFSLLSDLWQTKSDGTFKRQSYAAHLLRQGYGVVLSNHVDPLAASNLSIALPLVETLTAMGIPLNILTKFNRRKDLERLMDALDRPTGFYVSLTSLNADTLKRCEPGAASPEERLESIQAVVSRGHNVVVGINPIVPGWIEDPTALAKACKDAGASGIVTGAIHISRSQVAKMPERDRLALGEEVLREALKSRQSKRLRELHQAVIEACWAVGLQTYTSQQGIRSDALAAESALYPKRFPMMQEFVNYCHDTKQEGDLIYWQEFRDWFVSRLPKGVWGLRDHFNAIAAANSLNGFHIPQRLNYEKLLWYAWQHKETIICPANVECFAWAGDLDNAARNSWIRVEDGDRLPILVFLPGGSNGNVFTDRHSL